MPSAPQRSTPRPEHETHEERPRSDRWAVPVEANDRRRSSRWATTADICLIDASGRTILRCQVQKLSRTGLYAIVPVGFGLAADQCYEICLGRRQPFPTSRRYDLASCSGSIVRTDLLINKEDHHLGIAVQFDVPLSADVVSTI